MYHRIEVCIFIQRKRRLNMYIYASSITLVALNPPSCGISIKKEKRRENKIGRTVIGHLCKVYILTGWYLTLCDFLCFRGCGRVGFYFVQHCTISTTCFLDVMDFRSRVHFWAVSDARGKMAPPIVCIYVILYSSEAMGLSASRGSTCAPCHITAVPVPFCL